MFKDGILYSPYGDDIIPDPKEDTAVEYLLNSISDLCSQGLGSRDWLTCVESGETCKIDEVEPISKKVASGMYKLGMREGDMVLYSANEAPGLYTFTLGVWRANGIMRATYLEENSDTLVERILESKIKWALLEPAQAVALLPVLHKVPWKVEVMCFGKAPEGCISASDIMKDDGSALPAFTLKGKDMGVILNTSGTTGLSKGAVYTQRGLAKVFKAYQMGFYYANLPSTMSLARTTHVAGFCFPFGGLAAANQIYLLSIPTKENIYQAVQRYRPDVLFGFPKFLLYLATDAEAERYDLSSLKMVSTGGVVITPSFIQIMKSKLGVSVANGYAMTECPSFVSTRDYDPTLKNKIWEDHPDFSVGKLVPGTMMQVRDLDTGVPLGPHQEGELCFKNDLICSGYLNNVEESEKTFEGGWIRTGDVGYFDENGYVFVVDRLKEIFKYYNNHICPSELESVIQRHHAVENVCVVGILDSDSNGLARAFVTLRDPKVAADEIRKFADAQVADYKKLRGGLIVLNELPLGKTGKFDRKVLSKIQISIPAEE